MTLAIEGLTAGYKDKTILQDISFTLSQGEVISLAGANGSGKSTLLSIISSLSSVSHPLLTIRKGSVRIDNKPLKLLSARERALYISFMAQSEMSAWDYSALEIVKMGRYAKSLNHYNKDDTDIALRALEDVGALHLASRSIFSLSGGEQQRVRLARSICQDTPFMILDEADAALDLSSTDKLLSLLSSIAYKKNIGILFSTHNVNAAARHSSRMALLFPDGTLKIGSVNEMMTSSNLSAVYGTDIKIFYPPLPNLTPQAYALS